MIEVPTPAAGLLERYYMVLPEEAPEVWRQYVAAVRATLKDPSAPPEMRKAAEDLLSNGLSEDDPPELPLLGPQDDDEDPEGYGMDEPPEKVAGADEEESDA